MTKLDSTTAIQFKDSFLIPIKSDIRKLFRTNKIEFQIYIKENKIINESPKILVDLDSHEIYQPMEILNVS